MFSEGDHDVSSKEPPKSVFMIRMNVFRGDSSNDICSLFFVLYNVKHIGYPSSETPPLF
jgi:hypothetical protein